MIRLPPPLRFLAAVVALWTGVRTAVLAPSWWPLPPEGAAAAAATTAPNDRPIPPAPPPRSASIRREMEPQPRRRSGAEVPARASATALPPLAATAAPPPQIAYPGAPPVPAAASSSRPEAQITPVSVAPTLVARRWAVSAWTFWRRGDGDALASGGALGGSQAGARATYRLAPAVDLSLRLSAPIRRPAGAEAALGLDWKPARRLPLHLLAERRQAIGRDGRSAFGVTAYGGVDDRPMGPLVLDGYAQAGLVGLRRRDGFVDGSLRLSAPAGQLKLGAGAWAAAQPGVARLDIGPQLSLRLRLGKAALTVAGDWRFRVAGDARPGSGPALTLATGF